MLLKHDMLTLMPAATPEDLYTQAEFVLAKIQGELKDYNSDDILIIVNAKNYTI